MLSKSQKLDRYFLKVAKLTSDLSYAKRKKVGAVIAKDGRICSIGYNGTPSGWENCCEDENSDGTLTTKKEVVHAEANAILWCAKTNTIAQDATLYLTLSPCSTCALAIIQCGIKRVVYIEKYRDETGIQILEKSGIKVEQMKI